MSQDWEKVIEAVLAFVNAQTWDGRKRIVEKHRDVLLTDAADAVLATLLVQNKENENALRVLKEHRMLLARCRNDNEGIDAAFAGRLRPRSATRQDKLRSLLQELSSPSATGGMPRRVAVCREALTLVDRGNQPQLWAWLQAKLGYNLRHNPQQDMADNIEEAIRRYKLGLEVYTREAFPMEWAMTQHGLASAYRDRIREERADNIEEAIRRYKLALEVRKPNTLPQDCRDTANNLSLLLHTENRFAEARIVLETAHKAVEALRGELRREGAKRDLAKENAGLYAGLVHCCLIEGDEEAAFEYAVAGKGRAFVDMLATARFDLSAAGADDPQLAEDLRQAQELRQQIDNLLARLTGEGGASPEQEGEQRGPIRTRMQAELRSLREKEAAHWEEMSFRYPALTATQQAPALSAEEARGLAGKLGGTLVEYYRHAGGWCAFVVSPDGARGVRHVPLPGVDEHREKILGWLEDVESSNWDAWSCHSLRSLHRAVIAPLGDHLPPGGAVVLAPFSWLHLVPLNAALDPATGRYAADDYLLGFTPNLAALRVALDQEARRDAAGEQVYQKLLGVAYPGTPGTEHYLDNVVPETESVARHFPEVTPLYREAATPDAVVSHARGQDVIHFGCHGNFDPEAPRGSGLMLSGGRWLTVQQIITELNLEQTKLATIGACLSGRVAVRRGEEHVGLVQAMMSAGANAVVASLWSVNDTSTRALFEAFYAGIKAGSSPAAALAEASRRVREHPRWEHPYYWAAFQPIGLAHEGDDTGPGRPLGEVPFRQAEAPEEGAESQESKRGGSRMGKNRMVEDSTKLLGRMKRHPEELRAMLEEAGEKEHVVAELRDLEEQASRVQTEEDLLKLADRVHRLVEDADALREQFLRKDMDVEAARKQRWFDIEDGPSPEDLHVRDSTAQILNDVREIRWEVEERQEEETH